MYEREVLQARKNIMSAQDPIIGKRIGGYRVTTFIAHGSYGPVYYSSYMSRDAAETSQRTNP